MKIKGLLSIVFMFICSSAFANPYEVATPEGCYEYEIEAPVRKTSTFRTIPLSRYVIPAVVLGSAMMLPTTEAGPMVAGIVAAGGAIMTAGATATTFVITGGNVVAAGIVAEKGLTSTATATSIAFAAPTS